MDLNTFIQYGNNFKNSTKQFFDIDFTTIYDYFYGSNSNISSNISSLISSSVSTYNNTLINYYYGWLISQQLYVNYFNEYSKCIIKIEAITNYTNSQSSYQNILTSYYDDVCSPFINQFNSYFPNVSLTSNMSFFSILNYYVNKIRSETNVQTQAQYYAFCYANLSYVSMADVNTMFADINKLEDYYTTQKYFMTYYNNSLVESYMLKFKSSGIAALTDGNLITDTNSILDYNSDSLKNKLASMGGTTFEGFVESLTSSQLNPSETSIFPSEPACLNTQTIYQTNQNSTKLIEDGFTYMDNATTGYQTFTDYMNTLVTGPTIDFTDANNVFTCSNGATTVEPSISMDFYCGNEATVYEGKYSKDIFSETCQAKSINCDLNVVMTIELIDQTDSSILQLKINDTYVTLADSLPLRSTLNVFARIGESGSFTTTSSNGVGNIQMLTKMSSTDITTTLSGNKCLMDADNFIRLYITNDGTITYEYIPKIKEEINYIFDPNPTYAVKTPDLSGTYTTLYDNSDPKYKLGTNLQNVLGYVGYDGVYHNITEKSSAGYEEYSGFCFDENINEDTVTTIKECSNDAACIGTIDWPTTGSTSKYKITRDNMDRVYPCLSGGGVYDTSTNTWSTTTSQSSFNIKKYGISSSNSACIRDASNTQIIDYDTYTLLEKGDNFKDEHCGFNVLLDDNRKKLEETRSSFKSSFENMLTAFNDLNESELKMLQATKVNVNELSTMITEYNNLVDKTSGKMDQATTSNIQKQNSYQLHKKMEYTSALVGISAMVMAIGCFHYMKK